MEVSSAPPQTLGRGHSAPMCRWCHGEKVLAPDIQVRSVAAQFPLGTETFVRELPGVFFVSMHKNTFLLHFIVLLVLRSCILLFAGSPAFGWSMIGSTFPVSVESFETWT